MWMAPIAGVLRLRRFVQAYRHVLSGFYIAVFILMVAIWAGFDLWLNDGHMREVTGIAMFYPLLYVGWTVLRDVVTYLWNGLVWCVQRLDAMVRKRP